MILVFNQLPVLVGVTAGAWATAFEQRSTTAAAEVLNVAEWLTLN